MNLTGEYSNKKINKKILTKFVLFILLLYENTAYFSNIVKHSVCSVLYVKILLYLVLQRSLYTSYILIATGIYAKTQRRSYPKIFASVYMLRQIAFILSHIIS